MAEETPKNVEDQGKKKKGFNFKVILIGLPLFIIQLVLVYFITATFLVKNTSSQEPENSSEYVEDQNDDKNGEDSDNKNQAQQIFTIEDLIINPAGTSGQRLLLLSIGLGVGDEEKLTLLRENEVVIKDMIINTVSQKSLRTLSKIELKDSLKVELAEKINTVYPKADILNVYFSKYLIN